MKYYKIALSIFVLGLSQFDLLAQSDEESDTTGLGAYLSYVQQAMEQNEALNYEHGSIEVGDGLATLQIDSTFKYLNPEETDKILVEAWGNPPQETLGMIFPDSINPYLYDGWGVIINYVEDGYIEDEDAKDIDYDDMLEDLQDEVEAAKEERIELGYSTYDIIGWAEQPYYDAESKKLFWAKELKFEGTDENTLNYDIRILGRKGFLKLNAVASISQLQDVKPAMSNLLSRVEFSDGNTYFDFNPDTDHVAAYGIGALVAGKLAAKVGLLKVVGIFFAKFWKFILIGLAAVGTFLKKIFTGGGDEKRELE